MKRNAMEDFRRDVSYHLLRREDDSVLLTATMRDRFHDLLLEVVVDGESLAITDIRVDFFRSPSPDCPAVAPRLDLLKGMIVGPGMTRRLLAALGGETGCGNLRTLLMGLLPLVLNLSAAAGIDDESEMLAAIHGRLRGTCAGYAREAGRETRGKGERPRS